MGIYRQLAELKMSTAFRLLLGEDEYAVDIAARRPKLSIAINGRIYAVQETPLDDGMVELSVAGRTYRVRRTREGDRIHLQLESNCDVLKIAVLDHGPGLPSNGKPLSGRKLWAPFSKTAEEAAADKKPGIGLGLALSRRLAHTMKARLEYDADYEDGARFVLELPLCEKE